MVSLGSCKLRQRYAEYTRWDPFVNAKRDGPQNLEVVLTYAGPSGLLRGIGKGFAGLALRPTIGAVQFFVYLLVGLVKTPGTMMKALCLAKVARDDKVNKLSSLLHLPAGDYQV